MARALLRATALQPPSPPALSTAGRKHPFHRLTWLLRQGERSPGIYSSAYRLPALTEIGAARMESSKSWDGSGSQEDFMHRDECIVVDENDQIVGHDNKYNCHQFNNEQPSGILHRAFSVFLFDSQNRLLLQQRASDKITFPNVWTNTCCSHPLHGYIPSEVDKPEDVSSGDVPGVKAAAIRKLRHELGIAAEQLPTEKFKFLTRLHYCASDSVTYGDGAPWGEHELDYILFIKADVQFTANPEEVRDAKYVTLEELKEMMDPSSGLLWSPWFRIIAKNFLDGWWKDLDKALTTDAHVDTKSIHRLSV